MFFYELKKLTFSLILSLAVMATANAESARIAVASNFAPAMKALKEKFESQSDHRIVLAFGSTGKHYAQIMHGAPFDAFFAADSRRPKLLEDTDKTVKKSRFVYALGHLVMWSPDKSLVEQGLEALTQPQVKYIAIANPKLAPYGFASKEVLQKVQQYEKLKSKFVFGENINQTFQYVVSGNAQIGLIALSILKASSKISGTDKKGNYWQVPQDLHSPIAQEAVLLSNNLAASEFFAFLQSPTAKALIQAYGYSLPDSQ